MPSKPIATNKTLLASIILFAAALLFYLVKKTPMHVTSAPQLSAQTFLANDTQWGYQVMQDDTITIIRQEFIPGRTGREGFRNQADAEKVANLIIQKIKDGQFPPTVTEEELTDLGIPSNQ